MKPKENAVKKSDLARRQKSRFLPEWMLRDPEGSIYSSPDPLSPSAFEERIRRYDWTSPPKGAANLVIDCYTELL